MRRIKILTLVLACVMIIASITECQYGHSVIENPIHVLENSSLDEKQMTTSAIDHDANLSNMTMVS